MNHPRGPDPNRVYFKAFFDGIAYSERHQTHYLIAKIDGVDGTVTIDKVCWHEKSTPEPGTAILVDAIEKRGGLRARHAWYWLPGRDEKLVIDE